MFEVNEIPQFGTWRRSVATFGAVGIVAVVGVASYAGINRARAARELVAHTRQVIDVSFAVSSAFQDAETGQRGFLLTGEESYLAPYQKALTTLATDAASLRRLTADNQSQQHRLDSLSTVSDAMLAELAETIAALRANGSASARSMVQTGRGKELMDAIRAILGGVQAEERRLLAERKADEQRLFALVEIVLVAGTLAATVVGLIVNGLFAHHATAQERTVRALAEKNARIHEQTLELELQQQHLQEQTAEVGLQNERLQEQATELEAQTSQLEEQAAELEMANAELHSLATDLAERTREAERARANADVARAHADDARHRAESARAAAELANAAKSEFLAAMSHELRTPLNAIGGYVELLTMGVRGPMTEAQLVDLRRIKKSGDHLLALINEILNLARIESGKVDVHARTVAMAPLLEDAVVLLAPQMREKQVTCLVGACDEALSVSADVEKVQQILLNLLTNAYKFTDAGGRVVLSCQCADAGTHPGMVRVDVADTGRGIPSDKLVAIFEPFVQIDRRLTPERLQGLGLGLAISRDLARAMSGDLLVQSVLGQGSTFSLLLPLGTA